MDERTHRVIEELKKYTKIKKILVLFCSSFLVLAVVIILFYTIHNSKNLTKYIKSKNYLDNRKIEKIMVNPRIKFEYKEGQFYDISASKAIHEDEESDILLIDVEAKGQSQEIKAGKLVITDSGNDLFFTEQPILIIKQPKNQL